MLINSKQDTYFLLREIIYFSLAPQIYYIFYKQQQKHKKNTTNSEKYPARSMRLFFVHCGLTPSGIKSQE
jgi:hypothetical protein